MKLVYACWIDASGNGGWVPTTAETPITVIHSVGWLVAETDESVTIAASLAEENERVGEQSDNPITIPKVSIEVMVEMNP